MRIKSLTLLSNNFDSQVDFFVRIIGLDVDIVSSAEAWVKVGWSKLILKRSKNKIPYHYCFLIPNRGFDQVEKWARDRLELVPSNEGGLVHLQEHWNAKSYYFYDRDGNIVEFITRERLPISGRDEFDAQEIICINEIGAPVLEIAESQRTLSQIMGSKEWLGNDERFGTHGDEEGLILLPNPIVKNTWTPTQIKIEPSSFEATFEVNGKHWDLKYSQDGKFSL